MNATKTAEIYNRVCSMNERGEACRVVDFSAKIRAEDEDDIPSSSSLLSNVSYYGKYISHDRTKDRGVCKREIVLLN